MENRARDLDKTLEALQAVCELISGDVLLPSQEPVRTSWCPDKKLAGAVLASALTELRDAARLCVPRSALREDLEWISSNDASWPFSFIRLCETFDLDPEWVRSKVRQWVHRTARHRLSHHRVADVC